MIEGSVLRQCRIYFRCLSLSLSLSASVKDELILSRNNEHTHALLLQKISCVRESIYFPPFRVSTRSINSRLTRSGQSHIVKSAWKLNQQFLTIAAGWGWLFIPRIFFEGRREWDSLTDKLGFKNGSKQAGITIEEQVTAYNQKVHVSNYSIWAPCGPLSICGQGEWGTNDDQVAVW